MAPLVINMPKALKLFSNNSIPNSMLDIFTFDLKIKAISMKKDKLFRLFDYYKAYNIQKV